MKPCCSSGCGHEDQALERAKASGLRLTSGLRAVISALHDDKRQLSALELQASLRAQGCGAGLPTIYRICDNLSSAHILGRSFDADGTMRYYLCLCAPDTHHHHFVCRACGQISEVDFCPLEGLAAKLLQERQLLLEGHHLELYGLCARCHQGKRTSSP